MARILIVEDERILAKNLGEKLRSHSHDVQLAHSCQEAIEVNEYFAPDVIVLDLRLPDGDGLKLMPKLLVACPSTNILVVTAHGNERIAVEAMKAGAFDYLTKPVDLEELRLVVERAVAHQQMSDSLDFIRNQEEQVSGLNRIIGDSHAIKELKDTIRRLTRTEVLGLPDAPTVLITGETGTGKDLVAHAIHYHGPRRRRPFIHVNCTAIPATLFESELFGHLRGAFTNASQAKRGLFEVAEGGTLFLDEIGHLNPEMQVKLLHAIENRRIRPVGATQERPINVHVIAATNRDLHGAVKAGEFRGDLFHRLLVVHIHLPPLRERPDDVVTLANHFLRTHCERFGFPVKELAPQTERVLRQRPWRGNVRELSHIMERCVLQLDKTVIDPCDVESEGEGVGVSDESALRVAMPDREIIVDFANGCPPLDEIEHTILSAAFEYTNGNLSRAARILGITREALRYRLNKNAEAHA